MEACFMLKQKHNVKGQQTYLWHHDAGCVICSWSVPWAWGYAFAELLNFISLQMLYRPPLHSSQLPQGWPTSRATWSPTWSKLTPEPTAVTTPADSWPSVRGS